MKHLIFRNEGGLRTVVCDGLPDNLTFTLVRAAIFAVELSKSHEFVYEVYRMSSDGLVLVARVEDGEEVE